MASNWGTPKALYQACVDNDILITFCHQRRFGSSFVKAPDTGPDQALRPAGARYRCSRRRRCGVTQRRLQLPGQWLDRKGDDYAELIT